MAPLSDGGVLLVDHRRVFSGEPINELQVSELSLRRFDAAGDQLWATVLGDAAYSPYLDLAAVAVASDDTALVVWRQRIGELPRELTEETDPATIALTSVSADGEILAAFDLGIDASVTALAAGPDGPFVLHGEDGAQPALAAFDEGGELIWELPMSSMVVGRFTPGDVSAGENDVLVAAAHSVAGGPYDVVPIVADRYDQEGERLWRTALSRGAGNVSISAGGGGVVVGLANQEDATTSAAAALLDCADGEELWVADLPHVNSVLDATSTMAGVTILGGLEGIETFDSYLIGLSADGEIDESVLLGGSYVYRRESTFIGDIAASPDGGLMVAGVSSAPSEVFGTSLDRPAELVVKLDAPAAGGVLDGIPEILAPGSLIAEQPR